MFIKVHTALRLPVTCAAQRDVLIPHPIPSPCSLSLNSKIFSLSSPGTSSWAQTITAHCFKLLEAKSLVVQGHGDPDLRALSYQDSEVLLTKEEEACAGGHQRTAVRTREKEWLGKLEGSEETGLDAGQT